MKTEDIQTKLSDKVDSHFLENIVKPILRVFTDEDSISPTQLNIETVSSFRFYGLHKAGYVKLPKVDNFFFPKELYGNFYGSLFKIDALENFLPSIEISKFSRYYFYETAKISDVEVEYTTSNIFLSASKALKDIIEQERSSVNPNYICFLYYPEIVHILSSRPKYAPESKDLVEKIKMNLWLHFPVSKEIEKKYIAANIDKIEYPGIVEDLTIRVSCIYNFTYENILI